MKLVTALLAALLGVAAQPPAAERTAAQRIRDDVAYLASDSLQGRDTGSAGQAVAANYVAAQFKSLGLTPGGDKGSWFQQVPFRHAANARPPKVSFAARGTVQPWLSGRDFALRPSITQQRRQIDAQLVFAGHGISDSKLGIDEYRGIDARGKIVVILSGTPGGLPADVAAHLDSTKDDVAAAHGAIGIAEISNSRSMIAWSAGRPVIDWVQAPNDAGSLAAIPAMLSISTDTARKLFAGARRSFDSVRMAELAPVAGFPLPGRLKIEAESRWQDFTSPNVVAILPGSDPVLSSRYVIIGGHLDHLGVDPRAKRGEDSIFNGAMDNAAGVATLIEAARSFVASGKPPRRSVVFLASTGEERGLLGADFFAAHPPVSRDSIAGLVDLDMPLLTYDFRDVVAFGANQSTIGAAVAQAAASMGLRVTPDPMPEQALFVRSDHYRFVLRGIPALFLMTGQANGGKQAWDLYFGTRYHRVSDDLTQAVRWEQGAKFSQLNYRIARLLADADSAPSWYPGSYFSDHYAPAPTAAEEPPAKPAALDLPQPSP